MNQSVLLMYRIINANVCRNRNMIIQYLNGLRTNHNVDDDGEELDSTERISDYSHDTDDMLAARLIYLIAFGRLIFMGHEMVTDDTPKLNAASVKTACIYAGDWIDEIKDTDIVPVDFSEVHKYFTDGSTIVSKAATHTVYAIRFMYVVLFATTYFHRKMDVKKRPHARFVKNVDFHNALIGYYSSLPKLVRDIPTDSDRHPELYKEVQGIFGEEFKFIIYKIGTLNGKSYIKTIKNSSKIQFSDKTEVRNFHNNDPTNTFV